MRLTIPTQLTLMRIALIPIVGILIYIDGWWTYIASAALFGVAAITDWLDGYLARKWGEETDFGAFLDPVADKLLVVIVLVLLVQQYPSFWITTAGTIIIGREIIVTALREWMAELGKRASIKVSMLGKVKTTFQMTALIVLMLFDPERFYILHVLGIWCLYFAAVLTLWSMIEYLRLAWKAVVEPQGKI